MQRLMHQARLRGLSGWLLVSLAVLIAIVLVAIAAPFAVPPMDIPAPVANVRLLDAVIRAEHARGEALALELEREVARGVGGKHFDLRALGEALRAFGRAEAADDPVGVSRARRQVLDAVARARVDGDENLLAFRAFQTRLFLQDLREWERTTVPSSSLLELGGSFLDVAARYGWIGPDRRLQLDETVRSVFFRRRWNEITGLTSPPFVLSLVEQRAFYGFLLAARNRPRNGPLHPGETKWSQKNEGDSALRRIDELSRIDPEYPAALARGVVLYQAGRFPLAADAFREHLARFPNGANTLRARNYLMAAVARAAAEAL